MLRESRGRRQGVRSGAFSVAMKLTLASLVKKSGHEGVEAVT